MAVVSLSLSAGAGVLISPVQFLPMSYQNWPAGLSCLMNFSATGGYTVAGAPSAATGSVSLQVSNDPNANPAGTPAQQLLARWSNHDVLVNTTANLNSSIAYTCRYVRLIGTVTAGTVMCFIGIPDTSSPSQ